MSMDFDLKRLENLIENFYVLTGMRIVVFDQNQIEITSYPKSNFLFCTHMRKNSDFLQACNKSDQFAFEKCRKTQNVYIYQCHAGLVEAITPIVEDNIIIGYIMFGQIADKKNREDIAENLSNICARYNIPFPHDKMKRIKYKSNKQLLAAANILETCISYILQKNLIKPSRIQLFNSVDNYISENMNHNLSVESLCSQFNISRTRLYETMKPYIDGGIALYIRKKRLEKAKELLKTTDMSIAKICDDVGFSDYNYFLRVFKKHYGVSPKKMKN